MTNRSKATLDDCGVAVCKQNEAVPAVAAPDELASDETRAAAASCCKHALDARAGYRLTVGWLILSFPVFLLLSPFRPCTGQAPTEDQVKAAYIFNFLRFVEWPGDPTDGSRAKWVVGILGNSEVGDELLRLSQGKNARGRDVLVRRLEPADNLRACNILFISHSEKKLLPAILASLQGTSVLTVADTEDFVNSGGMIQLFVEDARVRIAIDLGATDRAHLRVSSKLLLLAHVTGVPGAGASN